RSNRYRSSFWQRVPRAFLFPSFLSLTPPPPSSTHFPYTTLFRSGFGAANAYAMMVFCLLYVPCMATIGTIHREVGKTSITVAFACFQLVIAWIFEIGRAHV